VQQYLCVSNLHIVVTYLFNTGMIVLYRVGGANTGGATSGSVADEF